MGLSIASVFVVLSGAAASSLATPLPSSPSCLTRASAAQLATRASPLDSLAFEVGGVTVKVCYGRPSARGRTVFGGLVPYGELWRTGANEPTMIHVDANVTVSGIALAAGTYSVYTVPGRDAWQLIVNRSTSQWGHPREYTADIEAQEVGRATVSRHDLEAPVETFTIRSEGGTDGGAALILEWETTGVRIPVTGG